MPASDSQESVPVIEKRLIQTRAGRTLEARGIITKDGFLIKSPSYIRATKDRIVLSYRILSVGDYSINMQYIPKGSSRPKASWEYQQTDSSFWNTWTITPTTEDVWRKGSDIN